MSSLGEGIAFFHWRVFNYQKFAKWHKGRDRIWFTWWKLGTGR